MPVKAMTVDSSNSVDLSSLAGDMGIPSCWVAEARLLLET